MHRLVLLLLCLCALMLAPNAGAAPSPADLAAATNFTVASRPYSQIHYIVIHVTEGPFGGTVAWLRDPKAHASANFVVNRNGQTLSDARNVTVRAGQQTEVTLDTPTVTAAASR